MKKKNNKSSCVLASGGLKFHGLTIEVPELVQKSPVHLCH